MTSQMRAAQYDAYGPPDVLRIRNVPVPASAPTARAPASSPAIAPRPARARVVGFHVGHSARILARIGAGRRIRARRDPGTGPW